MGGNEKVYKVVSKIPSGKVLTYGVVAKTAKIKSPRVVGNILHENPDPENIPCHRVVNSQGRLADNFAFGGVKGQSSKLEKDGVLIDNGKVNLDQFLWKVLGNSLD